MEDDLDRIEAGELRYADFLENEFEWLRTPYELTLDEDWFGSDIPTPAQIELLNSLAEETGTEVPDEVFDSKRKVSAWIDKLMGQIEPTLRLTDIAEAAENGVKVHRFWLFFNEPLPYEEYEYLKALKLKYKPGNTDRLPGFWFQRKDLEVVEEVWTEIRQRYGTDEGLDGFKFEIGGKA